MIFFTFIKNNFNTFPFIKKSTDIFINKEFLFQRHSKKDMGIRPLGVSGFLYFWEKDKIQVPVLFGYDNEIDKKAFILFASILESFVNI